MKLSLRLLAGTIVLLSFQIVHSYIIPKRQFSTLPLTPMKRRSDLHPQLLLQMHINRGVRRLAKMTGAEPPSAGRLQKYLKERILSIEGPAGLQKHLNRFGVHPSARELDSTRGSSLKAKDTQASDSAPAVTDATAPIASDSLGLNIEGDDVGYLATVQMGTPPRDFLILMDSGSADLWVGGEKCRSESGNAGCGNHVFLGPQTSSSFRDTGNPFEVSYGTGQVAGTIVQDNIVVAGLSLPKHVFGVASLESVDFSSNQTPFDGLMGLAKSILSQQQTPTPVESLASAGLIPDSIVSYKIPRLINNPNDGEITFGGLDSTKFNTSTLVTLPNVNPQGFWEASLDSITVNGVDVGLTGPKRTTILDTGTTLMILPPADATTVHNNIPGAKPDGQGGFTIPCTTKASVALTYSGQVFTIDTQDLAFQPVDANNPQGDCVSGIASGTVGTATEWLVGDTFLKNVYFSTNVSKNTVSLAKLV